MNMSPEKGPFQKEHGLRAIIFAGDMLVFRGSMIYDSQIRFFYNSFCFLLPNCYLSSISLICQDSCFRCSHVSSNQKLATKFAKTKCRCSKRHWHCFFPTKNTSTGRPSRVVCLPPGASHHGVSFSCPGKRSRCIKAHECLDWSAWSIFWGWNFQ